MVRVGRDDVTEAVVHGVVAAYEDDDHTVGQLLEELFEEAMPREDPEFRETRARTSSTR